MMIYFSVSVIMIDLSDIPGMFVDAFTKVALIVIMNTRSNMLFSKLHRSLLICVRTACDAVLFVVFGFPDLEHLSLLTVYSSLCQLYVCSFEVTS